MPVITLSKQRSRIYPAAKITDVDYVDDLVIFAYSNRNAEKLLNVLEESEKIVDLKVNVKNIQHMNIKLNKTVKSIDGEVFKNVDNFIYLKRNRINR